MRYTDLTEGFRVHPSVKTMSDEERLQWIHFLQKWLAGDAMSGQTNHVEQWKRFAQLFPHPLVVPVPLYRVMSVPYRYADMKEMVIDKPAPGPVGSWTSTKIGMDTVAGVATDFAERDPETKMATARIGVAAMIDPQNILATRQTIKAAFLSLSHDYDAEKSEIAYEVDDPKWGRTTMTKYAPWLGDESTELHMDLGYYQSLFREMPGGPYRQSEHIVITTPVQARLIYVYRYRGEYRRDGHDDPHNY